MEFVCEAAVQGPSSSGGNTEHSHKERMSMGECDVDGTEGARPLRAKTGIRRPGAAPAPGKPGAGTQVLTTKRGIHPCLLSPRCSGARQPEWSEAWYKRPSAQRRTH